MWQEDIIKKLFGGHDIKAACKDGKVPKMRAIHAEDLERGLPGTPSAGNQVNFFFYAW